MIQDMAKYRKVDTRVWGDEKFRRLSPLKPSGQALWLYLLTNPNSTSIPGLFRAGRAALAEELGWDQKAFDEAFLEASVMGMVTADWKSRVVWLPKSVLYNPPESVNVIVSWGKAFDEIPECELKRQAYQTLKAFVEGLREGFQEAFARSFTKPSPNQDQDQDQEQEQEERDTPSDRLAETGPARQRNEYSEAFERSWNLYGRREEKFKAYGVWKVQAKAEGGEEALEKLVAEALAWQTQKLAADGWKFAPYFERYLKNRRYRDEKPGSLPVPTAKPEHRRLDPSDPFGEKARALRAAGGSE